MLCRWRPISSIFLSFSRRTYTTHVPITLRPYQEYCLNSCTEAINLGSTRIGVSLPTGSGKTTVFVSLLSLIKPPEINPDATRSLIVVNSIELARQSAAQVSRMFPNWVVEIEQGQHEASGMADVTIATYQTLNNENRLMKFDSNRMKAIIIDEAHHAAAPSYRRLLSKFDSAIKHPDGIEHTGPPHKVPIIGFSATFSRHDGLALGSIFERIVYHREFTDLINEKWLCDVRFTSVKAKLNLAKVGLNRVTKDFAPTSLASVMNSEAMNNLIVRSWLDRASERKSTLVFCVNIAHVKALTQAFREHGIDAKYIVSSATAKLEREQLVKTFKDGQFPVLVNCAILTEGADIPNIDCVLIARPTRSRNVLAQMVGRGMRLSPNTGKTDCRIIDFVDTQSRVGGVVSTPSLFGLDPQELDTEVDDETMETLEKRIAERAILKASEKEVESETPPGKPLTLEELPNPFDVTYTDYEDPFSMIEEQKEDGTTQRISSQYAWTNCGDGIYALGLPANGFIRIKPNVEASAATDASLGLLYSAHYQAGNINNFGVNTRIMFTGLPLAQAIRACDLFLVNKVFKSKPHTFVLATAQWRKLPATDSQINLIIKRQKSDPAFASNYNMSTLTKGQASDILTRLKHGAIGRYKQKKKAFESERRKSLVEEKWTKNVFARDGPQFAEA